MSIQTLANNSKVNINPIPKMTMEEAKAKLSWEVIKVAIPNPMKPAEITPFFATIRKDTKQVFQMGLTKDYQVIQNDDLVTQAEAFLNALGGASHVSAVWSINGGASNALQIVGHPYHVNGNETDEIYPVFTLSNNHTGKNQTQTIAGTYRKICRNGNSVAVGEIFKSTIAHKGNIEEKIKAAHQALKNQIKAQIYMRKIYDLLAQTKVNEALVKSFLDEYLPNPEKTTQTENKKTMIEHYYHDADQNQIPKNTAYNLFQATTRQLNHDSVFRTRKTSQTDPDAARLQSIYQGNLNESAQSAFEIIIAQTDLQNQINRIMAQTEIPQNTYSVEDILAEMGA